MRGNTGPADDAGRYKGLVYLPLTAENDFVAPLPDRKVDLIYLCFPNNPTGATATRDELAKWVAYARQHNSIIFFDAAYEAYITDPSLPHSIYEVDGGPRLRHRVPARSARTPGFTGTRCAYTVVPKGLTGKNADGESIELHGLWNRRQSTKFNGVSYIVQRGAEAVYTEDGKGQVQRLVSFYLDNARLIRDGLTDAGMEVHGGVNAPYVWVKTPDGVTSWGLL